MRKIVQIVPSGDETDYGLYALCDDGTVYHGWWAKQRFSWNDTLPHVPQDEPPAVADPIAEIEARGGRLSSEGDIGWHVRVDGIWWSEIMASGGQLVDLRAAAARLLARVRGGA